MPPKYYPCHSDPLLLPSFSVEDSLVKCITGTRWLLGFYDCSVFMHLSPSDTSSPNKGKKGKAGSSEKSSSITAPFSKKKN